MGMQTDRPSARDINTLMVETRDLNKKVPKGQNLLGNFANFGIDGLESMGLPEILTRRCLKDKIFWEISLTLVSMDLNQWDFLNSEISSKMLTVSLTSEPHGEASHFLIPAS